MEIFCACPFAVGTLGWEPAPGRRSLSVCVKATFVLAPGAPAVLAAMQDPVRAGEAGDPAPDLVPGKPRVDVLFTGHAHAPGGAPTDSLIARARVGAFRKSLSINGDRTWVPSFDGLRPSVAVPFRRMPLTYDRAVSTGENLAGVDISQGAELNRPLANIAAIADQGGETPGLGPIPLGWRALRLGLGDTAALWASRAGLVPGPPPQGFDFRVFNAAPSEQQVDELAPGADVLLENLHPEHAHLTARLPLVRVKIFRRAPRAERSAEVPVRCDTLWIDTDRGLAIVIWRGAVLVEGTDDGAVGRLVVTAEADGERVGPLEVDRMLARVAPDVTYVDAAAALGETSASYPPVADPIPLPAVVPAAPFPSRPPPAPPPPSSAPPLPPSAPDHGGPPLDELTPEATDRITLPPDGEVSAVEALPFRPPPAGFEESPAPAEPAPRVVVAPPTSVWDYDEDTEVTPPRGSPSLTDVHAALPSHPPQAPAEALRGPDPYCAVKMEAWRSGQPLAEVLGRHGIDEEAFRAHEAAQVEALGQEAAEGRSDLAVALLDGLALARG